MIHGPLNLITGKLLLETTDRKICRLPFHPVGILFSVLRLADPRLAMPVFFFI